MAPTEPGMPESASTPTQRRSTAVATKVVPALAGGHLHDHPAAGRVVAVGVGTTPRGRDLDHGAGEALVGDHEVAAAAQHEHGLAGLVGPAHGVDELVVRRGAHPGAGRTTEPQRRVVAQGAQARTTATGLPSTVSPRQVTVSAIVRSSRQVPATVTSVPSSGTTTGLVNFAPSSAIRPGSPSSSST